MAVVRSAIEKNASNEKAKLEPAARAQPAKATPAKTGGGVSRTTINFWLDAWLAVNLLALVWIAFVMRFVFPPATAAAGWTLWGYSYDEWANAQFATLVLLMLGVLVHVMLHWTWVCGVITSHMRRSDGKPVRWDDGVRTLVGVSLLVVIVNILGLLMAMAALMVRSAG